MRKFVLIAAMISVSAPALAQDRAAWAQRRAERGQQGQGNARPEQSVDEGRVERPRFERREEQVRVEQPRAEPVRTEQLRVEQGQAPQRIAQPRGDWRQPHMGSDEQRQLGTARDSRQWNGQRNGGQWNGQRQQGQLQQVQPQPGGQRWTGGQYDVQRRSQQSQQWTGEQRGVQGSAGRPNDQRWSSQWRSDPRYDWQRYRSSNRSIFSLGAYYDPFGWGYRPISVGFTLNAGYYSPNYWLDDPWEYRLPPAYGPYRWVRYYNDAVLVDIYSGQAVEVLRNFFW